MIPRYAYDLSIGLFFRFLTPCRVLVLGIVMHSHCLSLGYDNPRLGIWRVGWVFCFRWGVLVNSAWLGLNFRYPSLYCDVGYLHTHIHPGHVSASGRWRMDGYIYIMFYLYHS